MTFLLVLLGLAVSLALWCWWEARRGTPQWGAHLQDEPARSAPTAKTLQAGVWAAVGLMGADGGDG